MSYLPRFVTRIVVLSADLLGASFLDGVAIKRVYAVPETDLRAEPAPVDIMGEGLKFWSAYVDSLTAQGIRVNNVVTAINDTEFCFGLSRQLSRTELELLSEQHPHIYKEHQQ